MNFDSEEFTHVMSKEMNILKPVPEAAAASYLQDIKIKL